VPNVDDVRNGKNWPCIHNSDDSILYVICAFASRFLVVPPSVTYRFTQTPHSEETGLARACSLILLLRLGTMYGCADSTLRISIWSRIPQFDAWISTFCDTSIGSRIEADRRPQFLRLKRSQEVFSRSQQAINYVSTAQC
jgi:hypothetical protein